MSHNIERLNVTQNAYGLQWLLVLNDWMLESNAKWHGFETTGIIDTLHAWMDFDVLLDTIGW